MKIKVFYPDRDGCIRFTKKELEDLLDEVYREGYNDARPYYWTSPYYWNSNNGITTTGTPLRNDSITFSTISSDSAHLNSATYVSASNTNSIPTISVQANDIDIPEPQKYQIKFED